MDEFADRKSCEFIREFASQFPSFVFLNLMGLPRENLPQFLEWEHAFFRGPNQEARIAGIRSIRAYMEGFLEERRRAPTGDLGSQIANGEIEGRRLNQGEAMGMLMVLYLGGLDTVASSLGWHFRHLANDQALQTRLRENPDEIPAAVNEFLRAFGVTATVRRVTEDFDFHGVRFKENDTVVLPTFLAGRDPQEFPNPHRIDPSRKARHMTLATGVHNCLGIHLAKRELKIVLEEWLSRFRNIHIPAGETARWHTEGVWGVSRLPLAWD
jgi:cytochrome P450